MPSPHWVKLTHERRVILRQQAIAIWKRYLDEERIVPHPSIMIPEYRLMLTHPDGELIVEEI